MASGHLKNLVPRILEPLGGKSTSSDRKKKEKLVDDIHRANHCLTALQGMLEGKISEDVLNPRKRVRKNGRPLDSLSENDPGAVMGSWVLSCVRRRPRLVDAPHGMAALRLLLGGPHVDPSVQKGATSGESRAPKKGDLHRADVQNIALPSPGSKGGRPKPVRASSTTSVAANRWCDEARSQDAQ